MINRTFDRKNIIITRVKEDDVNSFLIDLKEKTDRLNLLNIELNLDEKDTPVMDTEPEQENEPPEKKTPSRER